MVENWAMARGKRLHEELAQYWTGWPSPVPKTQLQEDFHNYIQESGRSHWRPVAFEEKWTWTVPLPKTKVVMRGLIDTVFESNEGEVTLVDYKFSNRFEPDNSLQPFAYYWAVVSQKERRPTNFEFWKMDTNPFKITVARFQYTEGYMNQAANVFQDLITDIQAKRFPRRRGKHCLDCPFQDKCKPALLDCIWFG